MKDTEKNLIAFFNHQAIVGKKNIEIRFIKTVKGIVSGIFKTTDEGAKALASEVIRLGLEKCSMYYTINKLSDEYINNFEKQYKLNVLYTNVKNVTKDTDISELKLIMLDFDSIRKANTSATDIEKAKAKECMEVLISDLKALGFLQPSYITDSGNGYNAYLLIDFPNDKEHNKLIADFIKTTHDKYSNEFVDVDLSTKNPSRIAKVPGSWSCKGDNTTEIPHRMCQLIETNENIKPVTEEQLKKFIYDNKPQKSSKKKEKAEKVRVIDVSMWLNSHGLEYKVKESEYNGKSSTLYILKECPFNEHDNEYCSFLAQFDDMSVIFKCHHTHCIQNIQDFIQKYPLLSQIPLLNGDGNKDILYNNVVKNSVLLKDRKGIPYIMLDNKVYAMDSAECKKALCNRGLGLGIALTSKDIVTVMSYLDVVCDDYSRTAPIGTRSIYENDYYYALTRNKAVHISNSKAETVTDFPVYFAYGSDFVDQTEPDLTSPASDLPMLVDKLFNISPQNRLKFLAQLCGFFMPDLPTPILVLSGGHGTSKTTTARKLVKLVDPKHSDITGVPDKEDGLTAILSNNYISVLDNIDNISQKFSDMLCIACTGGHISKRKLYTDNELVSVPIKSHIILNGIGDFINRPDLAERSNIIYLDPINTRLTEKQVWREFDELKPKLLGSIFNAIAKGLTLVDEMEDIVSNLPRMADFAQFGASVVTAMGLSANEFVNEYHQSNNQLLADCSSTDPFISSINEFVESKGGIWTGTSSGLLKELSSFSTVAHSTMSKVTPSSLSRKLNQCITDLKATGITAEIKATTPKSITLTANTRNTVDEISL